MIHIYYGFGKGKTTAAIGLGMRAVGAGKSVALVQFLKDNKSSELGVIPFNIFEAPESISFNPGEEYSEWLDGAVSFVERCNGDIIILDEFLDVIGNYNISLDDALWLLRIKAIDEGKEVIVTGHREIAELFDLADYVTYMDKVKHPFDKGIKARKGIEY